MFYFQINLGLYHYDGIKLVLIFSYNDAFLQLITREPIYYGPTDSSFKTSLVNWVLPYAQRYIYERHPEKYLQLKQSGSGTLNHLRVVVVEKLFYRNIIKRCEGASKKRFECSCLLQVPSYDGILGCVSLFCLISLLANK